MFFMVSAFQRGVTTRNINRIGGTGLNKSIMNFSKMSQKDLPENQSYVYSNKDILMFNENILSSELIGENIASRFEIVNISCIRFFNIGIKEIIRYIENIYHNMYIIIIIFLRNHFNCCNIYNS